MDWYLDSGMPEALPPLRRELMTYLGRHGEPGSDLDSAELLIAEAVGNAVRHTTGPVWVSLTWRDRHPTLSVYDLGPGFDPAPLVTAARPREQLLGAGAGSGAEGAVERGTDEEVLDLDAVLESGRGLMIIRALAPTLESRERTGAGMVVSMTLPVTRPATVDHDPPLRHSGALPLPAESLPRADSARSHFCARSSSSWPRRSRTSTGRTPPMPRSRRSAPTSAVGWRTSSGWPKRSPVG